MHTIPHIGERDSHHCHGKDHKKGVQFPTWLFITFNVTQMIRQANIKTNTPKEWVWPMGLAFLVWTTKMVLFQKSHKLDHVTFSGQRIPLVPKQISSHNLCVKNKSKLRLKRTVSSGTKLTWSFHFYQLWQLCLWLRKLWQIAQNPNSQGLMHGKHMRPMWQWRLQHKD